MAALNVACAQTPLPYPPAGKIEQRASVSRTGKCFLELFFVWRVQQDI